MTTADPDQKPRRHSKRVLLWVFLGGCVLGMLSLATLYLYRRGLATRLAQRQLAKIGAHGVEFRVATLDSDQTRVRGISLPGGAARVDSAGVSYSPVGLLGLSMREAAVHGAEVEIQRTASGWRVPVVDWISALQLPPPDPSKPKSFHVKLPTATLDGAVRVRHHELRDWRLPLHLSAEITPGKTKARATLRLLADEQKVEADLSPDLTGGVRIHGRLSDLSRLHVVSQYADVVLPVDVLPGGTARGSATLALVRGTPTAVAAVLNLAGSRCRWRGEEIGLGRMQVSVRSRDTGVSNWQAETRIEGLGGFGAVISDLQVRATGSVDSGQTELTVCRFRRGSLSGECIGKLAWYDDGRVKGSLTLRELSLGRGLVIRDAELSVSGVPTALDWKLLWHDEAGLYGLRSLELTGQASLTGEPQTTVTGMVTLDLGAAAKAVGLPGWAGEATIKIVEETAVKIGSDGVRWCLNLTSGCPQIRGAMGDTALSLLGVEAEIQASGTADVLEARLSLASSGSRANCGGAPFEVKGLGIELGASRLTRADVLSLVESPRKPLPEGSQATVALKAKLDSCGVELSQIAKTIGRGGLLGGALEISEAGAEIRWDTSKVAVDSSLAGECPDLAVQPMPGWRVAAPTKFRLKATGTPAQLSCEGNAEGEDMRVGQGQAQARIGAWNGLISVSGITPGGLAELPGRLSTGRKLPDGMSMDSSLSFSAAEANVAPWVPATDGVAAGGIVAVDSVKASLRGDERGLSGTLDLSGAGRDLFLDSPKTGRLGGNLGFSLGLGGTPTELSGSVSLDVKAPNWQRGTSKAGADSVHVKASVRDVALQELASLARDPFAVGQGDSRDKAALDIGLENGRVAGIAKGISLVAGGVLWSPAKGWRTGGDGARLRIGDLSAQGVKARGMEAVAHLTGQRLKASAKLPLVGPGVTAKLEATARLGARPSVEAALDVPEFGLSTDQGWVLGLGLFGETEFSGKISAEANARWDGGEPEARLSLALRDGNVVLPDETGGIEGLAVRVKLNVAPKVSTPAHQMIQFTKANFGPVAFSDGRARFQLVDATKLFVEEAHAGWCGGMLDTYALRFDTARTDVGAVVYARDVDVGEFIKLIPNVEGTGQGRLYGRLPAFRRSGRYGYGEGFLYSIPGEHGRLQLRELGVIGAGIAGLGDAGIIVDNSLRDLDYSLFRVDIRPQGHETPGIRIRVLGTEAGKENAQPVDLNINVLGAVEDALNIGMKMGAMKAIVEDALRLNQLLRRLIE